MKRGADDSRSGSGRPPGLSRRQLTAALLPLMAAPGCTIFRLDPPPAASAVDLPVLGVANARFWPDGPPQPFLREGREMIARQAAALGVSPDALPPANFLALSGGGDDGAFGAGVMNGWTATGTRPKFDIVTGISAGALIAPFAFLGPEYDTQLREVFTTIAPSDVLRFRNAVVALLFGEALADTSPLARLIQRFADEQMFAAIARSYGRGRLLLIGTTNLDLQRPVVWNIGAIAASGHPEALKLFRQI
ncbi:MAG: patatin-like phospholipase family protein, partial [Acetobacteraceae bacterium]|nr:patatin-like phospholipase family protein [Acetobacteraceae bacterium]